jgi:hypothetical protein
MAEKCSCIFGMTAIPGGQIQTEAKDVLARSPESPWHRPYVSTIRPPLLYWHYWEVAFYSSRSTGNSWEESSRSMVCQ